MTTSQPTIFEFPKNKSDLKKYILAQPEINYLWEGLRIEDESVTLLIGTSGAGKTLFAQYLMATIASEDSLLFGQHEVLHGPVIHIENEQSKRQTEHRYLRIMIGNDVFMKFPIIRQLIPKKYVTSTPQGKLEYEKFISDLCEKFSPKLILIDSFATINGDDENSANAGNILGISKQLASKYHTNFWFVHHKHKGKPTQYGSTGNGSYRGSTSIVASADFRIDLQEIDLIFNENNDFAVGKTIRLSHEKTKDGGKGFDLFYCFKESDGFASNIKKTFGLKFTLLSGDPKKVKSTYTNSEELITKKEKEREKNIIELLRLVKEHPNQNKSFLLAYLQSECKLTQKESREIVKICESEKTIEIDFKNKKGRSSPYIITNRGLTFIDYAFSSAIEANLQEKRKMQDE